jgi:hypothetical protein
MRQSIILGIGAGRSGGASLAKVLGQQRDSLCSHLEPPLLPWKNGNGRQLLEERFARFRQHGQAHFLGDVAPFYLPYVEDAIATEPDIRIICLKRPREEVVSSYCRSLDQTAPLPTNHWAKRPAPGWHHDPLVTHIYPQYDTQDREEGIRRFWDEYYQRVDELVAIYSKNICVFSMDEALNMEKGQRELLGFAGIPPEQQVLAVGTHAEAPPRRTSSWQARPASSDPMDPRRCAILVPFASSIIPPCERALQELERRGYHVRRVGGYAAIDQGRNQMATDALVDGFAETMWIDADIEFHPDSIDRLRSYNLPLVAGIYPQKGKRALASHGIPETPRMVFGKGGGLVEMLYVGAGFLLVRREVYLTIQEQLELPVCNERFRNESPMIPFFYPMTCPCEDGHWYLAEDYAFCERARRCGYRIMADTTIRLWHVGTRTYGWEDAGTEPERFETFVLNFGPKPSSLPEIVNGNDVSLAEFARQHPWPSEKPQVSRFPERDWLAPGTQWLLADSVSRSTRLIVEVGSWIGRSSRYLANLAPRANVIAVDHWQGTPEHQADPELAPAIPRLYETFLSECWDYRSQIIPVRTDSIEGLRRIADAGLQPDLVYLDGDHSFDGVVADVRLVLDLFSRAVIVGNEWNRETVRAAVQTAVRERGLSCAWHGNGWKITK